MTMVCNYPATFLRQVAWPLLYPPPHMGILASISWSPFYDISKDSICQCSIQLVFCTSVHTHDIATGRLVFLWCHIYGFRGYTVLMLIAAVHPVRVSYVYRFVTSKGFTILCIDFMSVILPVLSLTHFYLFIAIFISRWYGGYNCIK